MRLGSRQARAGLMLGLLTATLVATFAPARADDDDNPLEPNWSDKIGQSIKRGMTSATKSIGFGKPTPPPVAESPSGCPTISILDGTRSQRVTIAGATDNQGVRYQYSLSNVGRECTVSGDRIALRIAADGHVLLGPVGTPGHFDVPIRVVVVSELSQKPVASRLYRVPASIGAGQDAAPFQFVSDSLVVPIAAGQRGIDYSIKVGLDTKGTDTAKPLKAHRGHRKAIESAAATQ